MEGRKGGRKAEVMVGTSGSRIRMAEFYTLLDAILTI